MLAYQSAAQTYFSPTTTNFKMNASTFSVRKGLKRSVKISAIVLQGPS
jgi:hypothetical protein